MAITKKQADMLAEKLDLANVKTRDQGNQKLSYIEGWHVIAEANRIFGFDGWQRETLDLRGVSEAERMIGREPNRRKGWAVTYICRVRITVGDVIREGSGAGHGIDADLGLAHESAIKEAETDAMKRAFSTWGNLFGLALYDKSRENVEQKPEPLSEQARRLIKIAEMAKTQGEITTWVTANRKAIDKLPPDESTRVLQAARDIYLDRPAGEPDEAQDGDDEKYRDDVP